MTSDFVPKLAKFRKGAANPQIVHNSVQAYCLALLSDASCFKWHRFLYVLYRNSVRCARKIRVRSI